MKKYVDFSGRARRLEYWTFTLWNLIFALVAIVLDNLFGNADPELGYGLIYSLFSLAILLPTWAVTVRRLHDVGKSGWWLLISLIPILGALCLLIFGLTNSQLGDNEYGPNPKMELEQFPS